MACPPGVSPAPPTRGRSAPPGPGSALAEVRGSSRNGLELVDRAPSDAEATPDSFGDWRAACGDERQRREGQILSPTPPVECFVDEVGEGESTGS